MLSQSDPHSNKAHGSRDKSSSPKRKRGMNDPFGGSDPSSRKGLDYARGRTTGKLSRLGDVMGAAGKGIGTLGMGATEKGIGFYSALLGSAAQQQQALSPAITNITEAGQGARSAIQSQYQRGAARNVALDDELRRRQGSINTMFAGAPGAAADALSRLGMEGLGKQVSLGVHQLLPTMHQDG